MSSERRDLSYQSFVGKDLVKEDFSNCDLRRAIFDKANLEGADFSGSDLRNASFVDAYAMKAAFDKADLRGARFIRAKISLSNLQDAKLDGCDLRGIRGRYATWRRADWWNAKMDESLEKALSKKWPRHENE